MAETNDVGAAIRGTFEDRRTTDTSRPHQWVAADFEDPDNPPPLPAETPLGVQAGIRDIRRPTADEVMQYILHNAITAGDEPMTNSNVRRTKK
jgi:hypothetical protein